ncbi:signal peptide peptidase SppA [Naumannella sp. ID2617S]|nr:signal peptide peptidase SppA [Naumannella sp. ID2617S]
MLIDWLKTIRPKTPGQPLLLELDLSRGVLSAPPDNPLQAFRARQSAAMKEIRDGLRRGAEDDAVAGLAVHVGTCPLSPTECDELAELITEFGAHKPTIAWSETFGEFGNGMIGYRLATAAQEIWLQPSGAVGLHGVQLGIVLLRGGLAKLGVTPEFGQRKEYKSAADQFAATEVTDANREMMQRIADSILEDTMRAIAERRDLDPQAVQLAVDNSPLTAEAAREANLVDRLGYRDEVYAELRTRFGKEKAGTDRPELNLQFAHRYARGHGSGPLQNVEQLLNRTRPAIGVVSVHGGINSGISQQGPGGASAGSDTVGAHLREAARDDAVKAVVLRVNSPGGSYVASDAIRREVLRLREVGKPVIASMGDVAASGGYFVAMGADAILANPTTLTGSIGVLAGKFVTQGLFDKLGVIREQITAGANAGMLGGAEPFTEAQWEKLDAWLDEVYADFTAKAAADRSMELATLEPLARGRVWTGVDAHRHGLVDQLGGMGAALDEAARRVGSKLTDLAVRPVPAMPWLEQVRPPDSSEGGGVQGSGAFTLTGDPETRLAALGGLLGLQLPHGVLSLPWQLRLR